MIDLREIMGDSELRRLWEISVTAVSRIKRGIEITEEQKEALQTLKTDEVQTRVFEAIFAREISVLKDSEVW